MLFSFSRLLRPALLRTLLLLLPFHAAVAALPAMAAAVVAHSADDVCTPAADPCVVAQAIVVADAGILDFGLRTLRIEGSGSLDFGDGESEVACGRLDIATAGAAIRTHGSAAGSAAVRLVARRRCALASTYPCLGDADCDAVAGGSCSGGSGEASFGGSIRANGDSPGRVVVRSAGDLVLLATATVAGTRRTSDGGSLELESTLGSIVVSAAIDVSGGGGASGGSCSLTAAGDVTIEAPITADGGDYDGGNVAIDAGRDAAIRGDLRANATSGSGSGGIIDVTASRDIAIGGAAAVGGVLMSCEGHQSADRVGGDGGILSFDAGRNLLVARDARVVASAAPPDGFADTISFAAGGDVAIDGDVVAKARGLLGGGGHVDIVADEDVRLSAASSFELTGEAAGGDVAVETDGAFSSSAAIDVSGGAAGVGGRVVVHAAADVDLAGSWRTAGAESAFSTGDFLVEGCHVRSSARFGNAADAGRNRIVAHESFTLAGGGQVLASGRGASNEFVSRSALKPPLLAGAVAPPASLAVDGDLPGCAVCGNGEIDAGEGCDDGGVVAGDGCSARCQDEGCEAATVGDPGALLCNDGNECTVDRCDLARHDCVHTMGDCDDGVPCTADSCDGSVCLHEVRPQRCDDANVCTRDVCSPTEDCVHSPIDGSCDDGVFCDGADACADGACSAHRGDPCAGAAPCLDLCDEAAASCVVPTGRPCSDDANACTDDLCDGAGRCVHAANNAPCDDGAFCDGVDACSGGSCSVHRGNPCTSSGGCAKICNESSDSCGVATACVDDGNPCTADFCEAGGACVHPPVNGACDDGDFCSVGDTCVDGGCMPPQPTLRVPSLSVRVGRGNGRNHGDWKLEFPVSLMANPPSLANLRLVLADRGSRPVFDATLPAGSLKGHGAVWRYRAARGTSIHGLVRASLEVVDAASVVRAQFRLAACDLADVLSAGELSAALVFGDEPGVAPCASSGELVCERDSRGRDCASPP